MVEELYTLPCGNLLFIVTVTVTSRLAVRQSILLGAKPLEAHDQRLSLWSWTLAVIGHIKTFQSQSHTYYDRRSVGQPAFVSETYLGHGTDFSSFKLHLESYEFVYVGRPLWREVGSVVCSSCWASLAQFFSGPSPRDSWHFTVSNFIFAQSRGLGFCIYFLQEQSIPTTPPGIRSSKHFCNIFWSWNWS
jgi:hypothetical protein